jgi:hypothetical protein
MASLNNVIDSIQTFLAKIPSPFKSYIIPVESMKEQMQGIDSTKLRKVQISRPGVMGTSIPLSYFANPIKVIKCWDPKKDVSHELINGPSIETRITMTNSKRTVFYFDSLYIDGNNLVGSSSRIISSHSRKIPFEEIKKVEVQNSRKLYRIRSY